MAKIYIAGPMRGYPQFNFPAFDRAAALGRSLGWDVISPAEMDREHGIDENTAPSVDVNGGEPAWVRVFILRDVNILINTLKAEAGDAIAVLPGWEKSVGAVGEVALGLWAKLLFYDAETFYPLDGIALKGQTAKFVPGCEDGSCSTHTKHVISTAERLANHQTLPMCQDGGGPRPCITLNGIIIND